MEKKIQVGCGPKNLKKDWINVDIINFQGIDKVMDCTKPWPYKNEVDFIFGEHFLEHLTLWEALDFLFYAHNALKEQGRIRLTTPSLEWVITTHFNPNQKDIEKMIYQTYNINRGFHGWGHKFLYSKYFLIHFLESVGYKNIEFFKYGESNTKQLENLEQHGNFSVAGGFTSVWIVEGEKCNNLININKIKNEIYEQFQKYVLAGH